MNAAELTAILMAGISTVTVTATMGAIVYRVGKLVGHVEALMSASKGEYQRLDRDILRMDASLHTHLESHHGRRAGT